MTKPGSRKVQAKLAASNKRSSEENSEYDVAIPAKYIKTPNLPEKQHKNPDMSVEEMFTESGSAFQCTQCAYNTKERYRILRHIHKHIPKLNRNVSKQIFKSKHHVKKQKRSRSKFKSFQCQECEGSYKTDSELQRHIRYMHTFEKPYKCTECSYAAVEKSKLARHMMHHTGAYSHKCPYCAYASTESFKLKHHLQKHTEEKRYKCEKCNSYFNDVSTLKSHFQTAHSKIFTDHSMENRIKIHKQRRKFKCDICPYRARTKEQLLQHNSECKKTYIDFKKQNNLNPSKYVCNNCRNTFTIKKDLIHHFNNCTTSVCNEKDIEMKDSSDLVTITNKLKDGEVIILPEKDGEKYVVIQILPNEINSNEPAVNEVTEIVQSNSLKEYYVEIEQNRIEVKFKAETDGEMTDEEQPFYGF